MGSFVGVDGCRGGWVAARLDSQGSLQPLQVYPSFTELIAATRDANLVLVDMPIGLLDQPAPGEASPSERACDAAARALLGVRRASVFSVPVRRAVHAADYRAACDVNAQATGRKISQQAWHICAKIAQVDRVMRATPALQARVRECHPEVCFMALNNGQPMGANKKSPAGQAERRAVLERYLPECAAQIAQARAAYRRGVLADDDILDAVVLAVSARIAHGHGVPTLPPHPERDAQGLRMEIVCPLVAQN